MSELALVVETTKKEVEEVEGVGIREHFLIFLLPVKFCSSYLQKISIKRHVKIHKIISFILFINWILYPGKHNPHCASSLAHDIPSIGGGDCLCWISQGTHISQWPSKQYCPLGQVLFALHYEKNKQMNDYLVFAWLLFLFEKYSKSTNIFAKSRINIP